MLHMAEQLMQIKKINTHEMNTKSRLKCLFQFYRKQFIKIMQDNIKCNCTNQIPTTYIYSSTTKSFKTKYYNQIFETIIKHEISNMPQHIDAGCSNM